jgi:hypothetical protein
MPDGLRRLPINRVFLLLHFLDASVFGSDPRIVFGKRLYH